LGICHLEAETNTGLRAAGTIEVHDYERTNEPLQLELH